MNNEQKFAKIVTEVAKVRARLKPKGEGEYAKTTIVLEQLDFSESWEPYFTFGSTDYGVYVQMKRNKKKRVQAVPICFFITLYELDVKRAFPKEEVEISCTLKGFWKMERAVCLIEDFVHLQNKWQNTLLWGSRRIAQINQNKAKSFRKILEKLLSIKVIHNGWKDVILYGDDWRFCLSKTNVKLDIVPLCKMLTTYYVDVVREIGEYVSQGAVGGENQELQRFHRELTDFMEKHFTQPLM